MTPRDENIVSVARVGVDILEKLLAEVRAAGIRSRVDQWHVKDYAHDRVMLSMTADGVLVHIGASECWAWATLQPESSPYRDGRRSYGGKTVQLVLQQLASDPAWPALTRQEEP